RPARRRRRARARHLAGDLPLRVRRAAHPTRLRHRALVAVALVEQAEEARDRGRPRVDAELRVGVLEVLAHGARRDPQALRELGPALAPEEDPAAGIEVGGACKGGARDSEASTRASRAPETRKLRLEEVEHEPISLAEVSTTPIEEEGLRVPER